MSESSETPIREAKIARLKKAIAEGAYETPEKLEAAVEQMLQRHAEEFWPEEQPKRPK